MGSQESTSRSQHSVLSVIPLFSVFDFLHNDTSCPTMKNTIQRRRRRIPRETPNMMERAKKKGPKNELEAKVVLTGEALEKNLKIWIGEWRDVRSKEDAELKRLKDKQEKRKVVRNEENKKLEEKQAIEEKRRQKEVEDKKKAENEEKMKKLEEAEKRRQAILKAEAEKAKSGANYLIQKKAEDTKTDPAAEFKKTKEQLAEEKKVALQIRVKPPVVEGKKVEQLREMATEMWAQLVALETEKYDFEERSKRQDLK